MALAAPTALVAVPASSPISPPKITTTSLPVATAGTTYSTTLIATGGIKPYSWGINDGKLPAGLSLNSSTGIISGVPSVSGSFKVTILIGNAIQ